MKKRVIAIVSKPQECGTDSIDFVSLDTGNVLEIIDIDGLNGWKCMENKEEKIGKPMTLFMNNLILPDADSSRLQHYVGEKLNFSDVYYTDEQCTIKAELPTRRKRDDSVFIITKAEIVSRQYDPRYPNDEFMACTVCMFDVQKIGYILAYNPDKDLFYHSFKEKMGIELPYPERKGMNPEDIIAIVANKLNFDVVNILHY